MKAIDEVTYNIVKELQAKRAADRIEPVNVSVLDIQSAIYEKVKSSLNDLVGNGTLSWYSNLNGIPMFKIQKTLD